MKSKLLFSIIVLLSFTSISVNAEEKLRSYKDLGGQTKTTSWWKELASCGGTVAGVSMDLEEKDPKRALALEDESNRFINLAKKRLILDKGLSNDEAEKNATDEASEWIEYYVFSIEDIKNPKELDSYQKEQIQLCNKIGIEYKAAFPKDAQ